MRSLLIVLLIALQTSVAAAEFKIASYNIRNFDYDQRAHIPTNKDHLFQTIQQISPDLMSVQEINKVEVFKSFIHNRFNNRYAVGLSQCGGAHGQRLGFVYDKAKFRLVGFKEDLRTSNPNQQSRLTCDNGSRPLAIAAFKILETGQDLIAITVHLKSGGRPKSVAKRFQQLSILSKVVQSYRQQGHKNFVIMGDFNSTQYIFQGREYDKFKGLIEKMGLIDLAKDIPCTAYWWGGKEDNKQYPSILDHMLISPELISHKKAPRAMPMAHCARLSCQTTWEDSMGISFDEVSDHCPITSKL